MPALNWPVVSMRLSPAVIKQLDMIAEETHKTRTELIQEAVLAFIGMYRDATRKT